MGTATQATSTTGNDMKLKNKAKNSPKYESPASSRSYGGHQIDAAAIEIGSVQSASDVEFALSVRSSKYDPLIDAALKLKVGQMLPLTISESDDPIAVRNNLNAILRRRTKGIAHSLVVRRFRGEGGEMRVAIVAQETKSRTTRGGLK